MNPESIPNLDGDPAPDAPRDAVHIAVVPVVAGARLLPGKHICIVDGRAVPEGPAGRAVGVVSPFIHGPIHRGERCWVLLYPGSITSLRHEWTHPAFPLETKETIRTSAQAAAEGWLREFASTYGADYDDMIAGTISGAGYCFGEEMYDEITEEFWANIEIVTGRQLDKDHRVNTHFNCTC